MENDLKKTISCSNCGSQIEENFCSRCGQLYQPKRLNSESFMTDFADSLFSVNKSYLLNLKQLLLKPRFVIENYWNGYRNFFFSPNRMLFITAFLWSIYFYFTKNSLFGMEFQLGENVSWLGIQFLVIVFLLFIFLLSTKITYFKKKKKFFENLALNSYIFSATIPILLILSVFLFKILEQNYLQVPFTIFYFVWIARVFETKWWRILMMATINLIVLLVMLTVMSLSVYGIFTIFKLCNKAWNSITLVSAPLKI